MDDRDNIETIVAACTTCGGPIVEEDTYVEERGDDGQLAGYYHRHCA